MRFDRMSGMSCGQLDELETRVTALLGCPWNRATGRPRELTLREAIIVTLGYERQNVIEEVWAEIFDVSQSMISRIISLLTPLIRRVTEEFRPSAAQARAAVRGQSVLVDGSLAPCWSWRDHRELWSGKHKTTGFNFQVITNTRGQVVYVSGPMTGNNHDMTVLKDTGTAEILKAAFNVYADKGYQGSGYITPVKETKKNKLTDRERVFNSLISRVRAPVERANAHIKSWRVLHTDYRRPLHTYLDSFYAAINLYFFKLAFA